MSELTESLQGVGGLFLLEKGDRYSVSMRDANDIVGLAREACSALAAKDAEIEKLKGLNSDAHAIVARIWSIFGTPSYEQLDGRTIYDLVQNAVEAERRLREALEPFAKEADAWADSVPDNHRSLCTEPGSTTAHPGSDTAFTVGDIRAAAAALKGDAP